MGNLGQHLKTMYIDYKTTIWQRIHLDDSLTKEQILKILDEDKNTQNIGELYDQCNGTENEILYDTEEFITPKDNDGCNTIEFYDNNQNVIWNNVEGRVEP